METVLIFISSFSLFYKAGHIKLWAYSIWKFDDKKGHYDQEREVVLKNCLIFVKTWY